MDVLYFIAVGIVLYWVSDQILNRIEVARGERFEQRTFVFFFILLSLGLVTFWLLRWLLSSS